MTDWNWPNRESAWRVNPPSDPTSRLVHVIVSEPERPRDVIVDAHLEARALIKRVAEAAGLDVTIKRPPAAGDPSPAPTKTEPAA